MKREPNKNILYGIQKLLIESDLDLDDIDYIIYALNNGEISRSMKLTLESLKCSILYNENFSKYKEKNNPYNITASHIMKISDEKHIPFRRVFSFMRSIGFNKYDDINSMEEAIERFIKTSDGKSVAKLLEFINNYSGDVDPYLNALDNEKK